MVAAEAKLIDVSLSTMKMNDTGMIIEHIEALTWLQHNLSSAQLSPNFFIFYSFGHEPSPSLCKYNQNSNRFVDLYCSSNPNLPIFVIFYIF